MFRWRFFSMSNASPTRPPSLTSHSGAPTVVMVCDSGGDFSFYSSKQRTWITCALHYTTHTHTHTPERKKRDLSTFQHSTPQSPILIRASEIRVHNDRLLLTTLHSNGWFQTALADRLHNNAFPLLLIHLINDFNVTLISISRTSAATSGDFTVTLESTRSARLLP